MIFDYRRFRNCMCSGTVYIDPASQEFRICIHWGKVIDPTQKKTFLSVELKSIDMTLSLPQKKIQVFRQELQSFLNRKRAPKDSSSPWLTTVMDSKCC